MGRWGEEMSQQTRSESQSFSTDVSDTRRKIRGQNSGKAETQETQDKAANFCAHDPHILTAVSLQVSYPQMPERPKSASWRRGKR